MIILLLSASEMGSYFWHRFGAHTDIIPGVHTVHKIHHNADLTHEAYEDFYIVISLLLILGLVLIGLWYNDYLFVPVEYVIGAYVILFIVYVWDWYIHSAYHIPNHWLNNYHWFRKDKKMHLQHHVNPWVNYGIASHFSDIIFGTYEYPEEEPEEVMNKRFSKYDNYN